MTSKQYLRNSYYFNKRIGNSIVKMISCKMHSEKTTTSLTGLPRSNDLTLSSMEVSVVDRICIEENIRKEYTQYCVLREELDSLISEVTEEKYRFILRKRYMDALDWKEISFFTNYSIPYIYKLHTRALAAFDLVYISRKRG